MTKFATTLAALSVFAVASLPAAAADRTVALKRVSVSHMHYYDAYPWWWHPPYAHRIRTNYQPWPYFVRDPDYDRPYYAGVVGFRIF